MRRRQTSRARGQGLAITAGLSPEQIHGAGEIGVRTMLPAIDPPGYCIGSAALCVARYRSVPPMANACAWQARVVPACMTAGLAICQSRSH
jgi:hypothetical protein